MLVLDCLIFVLPNCLFACFCSIRNSLRERRRVRLSVVFASRLSWHFRAGKGVVHRVHGVVHRVWMLSRCGECVLWRFTSLRVGLFICFLCFLFILFVLLFILCICLSVNPSVNDYLYLSPHPASPNRKRAKPDPLLFNIKPIFGCNTCQQEWTLNREHCRNGRNNQRKLTENIAGTEE